MRPFGYESPLDIADAVRLIAPDGDGERRPLAGGTDLLTLMKAGIVAPARLVDIKRVIDLTDEIEITEDDITIGALASLAEIERNGLLKEWCPALTEAAALAASPQLRNMATIGGNLLQRPRCWYFRDAAIPCWLKGGAGCPARDGQNQHHALFGGGPCFAVHPSDPAAALLALDAEVRLVGPDGERTMPLIDFFALPEDDRRTETTLRPGEIVLAVHIPLPHAGLRSTYLKAMERTVWSFALVGVAASLQIEDGRITHARLVLAGVAPIPWRVDAAERLIGQRPGGGLFARVADAALADAQPLALNGYKVPLAKTLIRRALAVVSRPGTVSA